MGLNVNIPYNWGSYQPSTLPSSSAQNEQITPHPVGVNPTIKLSTLFEQELIRSGGVTALIKNHTPSICSLNFQNILLFNLTSNNQTDPEKAIRFNLKKAYEIIDCHNKQNPLRQIRNISVTLLDIKVVDPKRAAVVLVGEAFNFLRKNETSSHKIELYVTSEDIDEFQKRIQFCVENMPLLKDRISLVSYENHFSEKLNNLKGDCFLVPFDEKLSSCQKFCEAIESVPRLEKKENEHSQEGEKNLQLTYQREINAKKIEEFRSTNEDPLDKILNDISKRLFDHNAVLNLLCVADNPILYSHAIVEKLNSRNDPSFTKTALSIFDNERIQNRLQKALEDVFLGSIEIQNETLTLFSDVDSLVLIFWNAIDKVLDPNKKDEAVKLLNIAMKVSTPLLRSYFTSTLERKEKLLFLLVDTGKDNPIRNVLRNIEIPSDWKMIWYFLSPLDLSLKTRVKLIEKGNFDLIDQIFKESQPHEKEEIWAMSKTHGQQKLTLTSICYGLSNNFLLRRLHSGDKTDTFIKNVEKMFLAPEELWKGMQSPHLAFRRACIKRKLNEISPYTPIGNDMARLIVENRMIEMSPGVEDSEKNTRSERLNNVIMQHFPGYKHTLLLKEKSPVDLQNLNIFNKALEQKIATAVWEEIQKVASTPLARNYEILKTGNAILANALLQELTCSESQQLLNEAFINDDMGICRWLVEKGVSLNRLKLTYENDDRFQWLETLASRKLYDSTQIESAGFGPKAAKLMRESEMSTMVVKETNNEGPQPSRIPPYVAITKREVMAYIKTHSLNISILWKEYNEAFQEKIRDNSHTSNKERILKKLHQAITDLLVRYPIKNLTLSEWYQTLKPSRVSVHSDPLHPDEGVFSHTTNIECEDDLEIALENVITAKFLNSATLDQKLSEGGSAEYLDPPIDSCIIQINRLEES